MTQPSRPRIALALAGGGPLGAIYEIGALCALQEALDGLDLAALDHYVGVSAGGFIAAGLANGMTPRALCDAFIENRGPAAFDPAWLMTPAWSEFGRRAARLPALAAGALWQAAVRRRPLAQALEQLAPAVPTGLCDSEPIHARLSGLFAQLGLSNDFRTLRSRLTLVATDLDTSEPVRFGAPGWDHVPISRAVQASAALPGLFPPVRIDGRDFVDGALRKTMHASVALEEGADLMLCLNPLVPFRAGTGDLPRVADGGLAKVMGQTLRSLIHSRLDQGMKQYARSWPHADIVLLEPDQGDPQLFLANPFSYRQRRELAAHAYQQTRAQLLARADVLGPQLARHGIRLRTELLQEPARLVPPRRPAGAREALAALHATLDQLEQRLPAPATATP